MAKKKQVKRVGIKIPTLEEMGRENEEETGVTRNQRLLNLAEGMKLKILKEGKVIDEVIVKSVTTDENGLLKEVKVESLKGQPGMTRELALIKGGWKVLFEDPMRGYRGRCFSRRAATYTLEPA